MKTPKSLNLGILAVTALAAGFVFAAPPGPPPPGPTGPAGPSGPPRPPESPPTMSQPMPANPHSNRPLRHHPTRRPANPPQGEPKFGDPIPGLTPDQLSDFMAGKEEFENVETPESGLGPIFNNVSCVACHSVPAAGGGSAITVTRFGRMVNGLFDPLAEKGGSLLQQFAIDPRVREVVPPEANVVAHRKSTPLFGLGLIEAIPDKAIVDNAYRRKPDGITGVPSVVNDVATGQIRIGRFGWKAQQAVLLSFAGDAYVNEMGITSRLFPTENAPNGNTALLAMFDRFGDPEDEVDPATGKGDIDAAADFMRYLAPPPPVPKTRAAIDGETLFNGIGCAQCHTPMMNTGPSSVAALSNKAVWLYSDLLLHDMGSLGDGIAQGTARTREMKTAPLWGLRVRPPYLHDGRAPNLDAAIMAHDGEGAVPRDRYQRLAPFQKQQLIEFLNSI